MTDTDSSSAYSTISEILFYHPDAGIRSELELFRKKHEALYGLTDLTRRYTCSLPHDAQVWLIQNEPKRYFDGLPPFVKDYYRDRVRKASMRGTTDLENKVIISLYASGQLFDEQGRNR